jgi:uncharacterized spore protein YtfJ
MADLQIPQATFLDRLADKIEQTMGAKAVFGEPVQRDGTTVIPVAQARWGVGGGMGTRMRRENEPMSGTGGGGGGVISPLGFIEMCEGEATFKPIRNPQLTVIAGTVLGLAALRMFGRVGRVMERRRTVRGLRFMKGLRRRRSWLLA